MKKLNLTLIAIFAITQLLYAQWTNQSGTGNYYITSGKIGIGTLPPAAGIPLTVQGLANSTIRLLANGGSGTYWDIHSTFNNSNPDLIFSTASLEALRVNSSGNVGIGTTNPSSVLSIGGSSSVNPNTTGAEILYSALTFQNNSAYNVGRIASIQEKGNYIDAGGLAFYTGFGALKEKMRIRTDGNVGIGTANPGQGLQVISSNVSGSFGTFSSLAGQGLTINPNSTSGIINVYTDYLTGSSEPKLHLSTYSNHLNTKGLNIDILGNVGIGTSQPDQVLTVNGTIHSKEVKVDNSIPVPDYVFEKTYKPLDLTSLKEYLNANHHLPEIPSAVEMEKNGLNLGEMNLKLLKKVEELTLYLLEKEAQVKQLQSRLEKIESQLKRNHNL